jgi:hypothetical protein
LFTGGREVGSLWFNTRIGRGAGLEGDWVMERPQLDRKLVIGPKVTGLGESETSWMLVIVEFVKVGAEL